MAHHSRTAAASLGAQTHAGTHVHADSLECTLNTWGKFNNHEGHRGIHQRTGMTLVSSLKLDGPDLKQWSKKQKPTGSMLHKRTHTHTNTHVQDKQNPADLLLFHPAVKKFVQIPIKSNEISSSVPNESQQLCC